jgi:hypothetical protein
MDYNLSGNDMIFKGGSDFFLEGPKRQEFFEPRALKELHEPKAVLNKNLNELVRPQFSE